MTTPLAFAAMRRLALAGGASWLGWVLGFVYGLLLIGSQAGLNALVASRHPTSIRSTGIGWAGGIGRLTSMVGPAIGAVILAAGWAVGDLSSDCGAAVAGGGGDAGVPPAPGGGDGGCGAGGWEGGGGWCVAVVRLFLDSTPIMTVGKPNSNDRAADGGPI
jgi:hypothetical protein